MQPPARPSAARPGRFRIGIPWSTRPARALLPLFAGLAIGLATPAPAETVEKIATVGDQVITTQQFAVFLKRYVRQKLYHGGSEKQIRRLAEDALDAMITERLLAASVERRGITGDPTKVAAQIADYRERYSNSPSWPQIEPRLGEIERDLLLSTQIAALRQIISEVAPPGEAALRDFYAEKPKLFTQPAAHDVDLILFGVPPSALSAEWEAAETKAAEARAAILGGADFAELAKAQSTHSSAASGGAAGKIHQGQLPTAADSAIEAMEPGELSEPIRILEGYLVLRLNDRFDAQLQPFETVRERVEALYRRERAESQWDAFIAGLRKETEVKTFNVKKHVDAMLAGN